MTTRVLVVEDQDARGEKLSTALSSQGELEVVGTATNGEHAVRTAEELDADFILMDMDPRGGFDGGRAAKTTGPKRHRLGIAVLPLDRQNGSKSPDGRPGEAPNSREGSLSRVAELARAIGATSSGLVVLYPTTGRTSKLHTGGRLERLRPRQLDVLRLMAQGRNNASIARTLFIGEKSVENVINRIFRELDIPKDSLLHPRTMAVLAYLGETRARSIPVL